MFKKALAVSAAFASLAVGLPVEESGAAPIVPIRNQFLINLEGTVDTSLYRDFSAGPGYENVKGYQIAPQFLVIQDFDDENNPLAQVDLYAQDVFSQWNDASGVPQPFFNFVSPLHASDIDAEKLKIGGIDINALIASNSSQMSSSVVINSSQTSEAISINDVLNDPTPSIGFNSIASGNDAGAFGKNAEASGTRSMAVGVDATAIASNSIAVGDGSFASGVRSSAFGVDATANGSSSTAVGDGSFASGVRSSAFGTNARSIHTNSTAIGVGSTTSRANQLVLGNKSTEVTIPNLSGDRSGLLSADKDGTLRKLEISGDQLEDTINQTVPGLETAARGLGLAMQTSGAIGAAMSSVPEITLEEDEPIRCAVGVGGYGSQYATAAGCALRIKDRIQLNGAISYAPSIDYVYGSTSSIAGRLGISFPLGTKSVMNKSSKSIKIEDLVQQINDQSQTIEEQKSEIESLKADIQNIYKQLGIVPGNLSSIK